jgi:cyanophycin synthetase
MRIRSVKVLRGPNLWATKYPVLEAEVDLGALKDTASSEAPGFNERLTSWLPTMIEHRCSVGERGGFFERLRRGTYLAHILEHVTLELQTLAGTPVGFGRTRETDEDGVYRVAIEYEEEKLGLACLETARALCMAAVEGSDFDVAGEIQKLVELKNHVCPGPSTAAILNAARKRGIPIHRLNDYSLYRLGHGVKQKRIQASETSSTSAIGEQIAQDKQLTRTLLREAGVPVPQGWPAETADEAWEIFEYLQAPVVVKPRYGNQGRGVAVNLSTRKQVEEAFAAAKQESSYIVVEQYAPGFDHRLLVVDGKLVAAALREPPHVFGDGRSTIAELVAVINADPRRADDHAGALSKIPLDEIAIAVLSEQGFTLESVPPARKRVLLRRNGNLSTGGTATDVTDLVHPEVAAIAIDAARVVGLDVAGIDIVVEDISRPLEPQRGVVVEVNAAPGLRMHIEPSTGTPRPVGEAIVASLIPQGDGRIPIVGVTGTNGKTTTTRLIASILGRDGSTVGMTCSDGIVIGDRQISSGDCSGPESAGWVLGHPRVERAVFETARGGILRAGLGFDRCDVAVVTNIGEADHLGIAGIDTAERMAYLKRTLVEAVAKTGAAVLNAADPLVVQMSKHCPGETIYFAIRSDEPVVVEHLARGGKAVFVKEGAIVLAHGEKRESLINLAQIPTTRGGRIGFQVENVLAATGAAWAIGVNLDLVRAALEDFRGDPEQVPGRFNVVQTEDATVLLDYVHNISALEALIETLDAFPHERRSVVYTVAGDRRDEDIIEQARLLGEHFDVVYTYEGDYNRGRASGEIFALMRRGLERASRVSEMIEIEGERAAVERSLADLRPGDLLLVQVGKVREIVELVRKELADHHADADHPPIHVSHGPLGKCIVAARDIEPGECILQGWGRSIEYRTRHSIQVDHDRHIIVGPPIQLINHSCEPNCGVLIRRDEESMEIHARRPIAEGEELTIDYATFEYDIQFMPGDCLCGTPGCRKRITGYKDMPRKVRQAYGEYIAEYLVEREAVAASAS